MKAVLFFAIVCVLNGRTVAQNLGTVRGKVIDERTHNSLAGANVMILGGSLGASTDSLGEYSIPSVPEGLYELQIRFVGYRTYQKPDIRVVRNKVTIVPEIQVAESSIETGGMTVTAGVFQDHNDMPVSSFSFTKDEIRRSPGAAGDIFRALGTLPGVATEGGELSEFSVRGGGPKDNLILVDNIPFTKVSHFDDGGIEGQESQGGRFGIFAPRLIEEADFSAGGFPARFGGKNSSIINMKIKEGNVQDVTAYGHYDLFGWEANYDGPLPVTDKSGLIVSARHVDFKTVLTMIDEKGHGNPDYTDVLVKSTTEITSSHKISFLGVYSDDHYTRTAGNVFDSKDINENQLMNHNDYRYMIGANDRCLLGALGFVQTSAYYYRNEVTGKEGRVNTAADFGVIPTKENSFVRDDIYQRTVHEQTFGLKSDWTLSFDKNVSLFAGIESRQNEYRFTFFMNGIDTLYNFSTSDYRSNPLEKFIILIPQRYNQENNFNNNYYAGYAEVSLKFSPKFTANPGVRYEYYTYSNRNYLSPRFSMRYQVTTEVSLNASAGLYYQLPELSILALDQSNGSLKNEQAVHFIIGTSVYLSNDVRLTVESYYKKFDDLLVRTNSYDLQYSNEGTGWASGFDISVVKRFSDKYYGQASYSYTVSKRNDHKSEGEYDYRFSKPHIFTVLGGYQFNGEWSLTAKWLISSGLPTDEYVVYADVLKNPNVLRYSAETSNRNSRRFATNQSFDIRMDYRTQLKYFALNLYLDIWNLFGTKNVTSEEFLPQSGQFNSETLQTVPTFGFSLEF